MTSRSRTRVDPVRRVAFDVVHAVTTRDSYANLALTAILREREMSGRDAAFATELTHGTLRRLGGYDQILAECVDRPLDKLDPELLDVMRLGVHQVLGMRVAPHAAVATTVDLARAVRGVGPSKLVNAVLRKVSARGLEGWLETLAPSYDQDPMSHLAVRHFHPRWIVEAFAERLDGSLEETAMALAADNQPPKVTLAMWPGQSTVGEIPEGQPGRWSPYAVTLEDGDPGQVLPVAERRAGVQDQGSQLMALALAQAALTGRDERWLDLCAGPGGKAALLAGLAADRSARVLAVELQQHRAALVARTLGDAPGVSGTICADGTTPAWPGGSFDRVLVDAPCTGLGALRRRPEARWRRTPDDAEELHPLQVALLRSALEAVRPGGVVAYATCSPHPRETRAVVDEVLHGRDDAVRVDARAALPAMPGLGDGPDVQLWPHRHDTDGMYLALLRREPGQGKQRDSDAARHRDHLPGNPGVGRRTQIDDRPGNLTGVE